MVYDNQLLSSLVLDAIRGYTGSLNKVHPERNKQIEKLKKLCTSTQYDMMLELGTRMVIKEIKLAEQGWFASYPSRLRVLLENALTAYYDMVEYSEIQSVLFKEAATSLANKPKMPTTKRILEETAELMQRHA